jgi:hypothetical protein
LDAGRPQLLDERLDRVLIDSLGVREQGVADQTIAVRCRRIDGQRNANSP